MSLPTLDVIRRLQETHKRMMNDYEYSELLNEPLVINESEVEPFIDALYGALHPQSNVFRMALWNALMCRTLRYLDHVVVIV